MKYTAKLKLKRRKRKWDKVLGSDKTNTAAAKSGNMYWHWVR